jgi:hypothetical protein
LRAILQYIDVASGYAYAWVVSFGKQSTLALDRSHRSSKTQDWQISFHEMLPKVAC